MRVISLAHRFLFIHIPKTGGNSVQNVLRDYADDVVVTPHSHQDGYERFELWNSTYGTSKHATFAEYDSAVDRQTLDSLFKFATIRNPWDRMVSFYFSPHRGAVTWDRQDFIQLICSQPTARHYLCVDGATGCALDQNFDMIMKFENLEQDFAAAADLLNIQLDPLPRRNASSHEHYSHYYDAETTALVEARFAEEIAFWGYEFETG